MKDLKNQFLLNTNLTYLNHGTFGACPKPIFEDYLRWELELERSPVYFTTQTAIKQLQISKEALAAYIHCQPDDLVLTTNPSYAINIIAKSFPLKPGDEILTTNLEYGAMDRTWKYYCEKSGAHYIQQYIPLPITSKEDFIEHFWKGLTPNTKAIFISHITSSTGLILPVKEICERAKNLGLITIVDGAHVPGHIPLNLNELQADIYTGALHKWLLTPKGCSFLYVKKEYQTLFDPLLISWGYKSDKPGKSTFLDYHEAQGTRDISAFFTIPKALQFLEENNWPLVAQQCRALIKENYAAFCDLVGSSPICPITDDFLGQMCSIPIHTADPIGLKQLLFDQYHIEIPIMQHGTKVFMRISMQAYNTQEDLEKLKTAIIHIQKETTLISLGLNIASSESHS